MRSVWIIGVGCLCAALAASDAAAQTSLTSLTWAEVRARFEANNPTLHAGELGIDESRADELTAFLRPNPQLSVNGDQATFFAPSDGSGRLASLVTTTEFDYMRERGHKRELRRDSATGATAIAVSTQQDLERTLTFSLRAAFVQALQAKAFLALAQQELADYDQVLTVSRERLRTGDIAQIDLDRLELQRVQYESDFQTATVNARTSRILLLQLLNDKTTSVEQFDVTGAYDFIAPPQTAADLRQMAMAARPDLKAAMQAVDKANVDYHLAVSNGTTDPTLSVDAGWARSSDPSAYFGLGISIPLRIFDQNQGEKLHTKIDITRNETLADATRAQVVSDVDSAYATVMSTVALLQPYKARYLAQATRVRDTMSYSYQRGGAALIDFLQAQQDYRTVQIAYVNLVAAFLNAAAQLNLATGQEVIP